jgi:hypothetical protein
MNMAIQWVHHRKRKYYAVLVCHDLLDVNTRMGSLNSRCGGQKTELRGSKPFVIRGNAG